MRVSEYEKNRRKMAEGAKRRRRQAAAMRKAGMTFQEIGAAFGVSRQAAQQMVAKHLEEGKK